MVLWTEEELREDILTPKKLPSLSSCTCNLDNMKILKFKYCVKRWKPKVTQCDTQLLGNPGLVIAQLSHTCECTSTSLKEKRKKKKELLRVDLNTKENGYYRIRSWQEKKGGMKLIDSYILQNYIAQYNPGFAVLPGVTSKRIYSEIHRYAMKCILFKN